MLFFFIPLCCRGIAVLGFLNKRKHVSYSLVKVFHGKRAVVYGFYDKLVILAVAGRHLKVKTCGNAKRSVINCTPIAYYKSIIAPFVSEYISEQELVL